MKLYSQSAEIRAIQTIAVSSAVTKTNNKLRLDASSFILGSVDQTYFHYDPCKAAYLRITSMLRKRAITLSYEDLLEDPTLNEDFREILREVKKKPVKTVEDAAKLVETLTKYRKARLLYFSAKNILDTFKADKVDIDLLLDDSSNRLAEARSSTLERDPVLTIGKDANALDLLDQALSSEDSLLLKTGFEEFDRRSGGLPAEGVFLMAGTTSGGKSVMRMNLLVNMYRLNKIDVSTISFEMNEKKETRRLLSSITDIPFWKFTKKALTTEEREICKTEWLRFHKFGKKHGCKYSIMCPTRGLDIHQVLMIMKPYNYKVIAIDYVSLLAGVDDDNQPKMLKSIVRESKIFSSENNCLIILLAQLDSDDSRIRYSKGMLEDADNSWIWNYTAAADRDRQRIPIKQKKARDQELYDFELEENFAFMQILNPPEASNHKETNKEQPTNTNPLESDDVEYAVD